MLPIWTIAALTLFTALAAPSAAQSLKATAEDRASVEACLARVSANGDAEATRKDVVDEAPGPEGRLKEAQRQAPMTPESCIGAVSAICMQAPDGSTTQGMIECAGREWAVWDERLNSFYRKVLKDAEPKLASGLRTAQRAWLAWREASCNIHALENEGGSIVGPLHTSCMMEATARQALWLETRAQ